MYVQRAVYGLNLLWNKAKQDTDNAAGDHASV